MDKRVEQAFADLEVAKEKLTTLHELKGLDPTERFVLQVFGAREGKEKYEAQVNKLQELDQQLREGEGQLVAIVCEAREVEREEKGGCMGGTSGYYSSAFAIFTGTLTGKGLAYRAFPLNQTEQLFGYDTFNRNEETQALVIPTGASHERFRHQEGHYGDPFIPEIHEKPLSSKKIRGRPIIPAFSLPYLFGEERVHRNFMWPFDSKIMIGEEAQIYVDKLRNPPLLREREKMSKKS